MDTKLINQKKHYREFFRVKKLKPKTAGKVVIEDTRPCTK